MIIGDFNGLRRLPGILIGVESGAEPTTGNNQLYLCVEVVNPVTPVTSLNLKHLTRNTTRNRDVTTRNSQSRSVHIQDKCRTQANLENSEGLPSLFARDMDRMAPKLPLALGVNLGKDRPKG